MPSIAVEAVEMIARLRGSSQPILVKASDGQQYIVKLLRDRRSSNLAFNEALGTEIFRQAGIPVPEWRPVIVSGEFLDLFRGAWTATEGGIERPSPGTCFGSRLIDPRANRFHEMLPGSLFPRIANRSDFWTAWLLDVLCEHADNRQAIFLEDCSGRYRAYFLDHGHLFGGPAGSGFPSFLCSRYLDARVYPQAGPDQMELTYRAISRIDLGALSQFVASLPRFWLTENAGERFLRFSYRFSEAPLLSGAIRFLFRSAGCGFGGCHATDGKRNFWGRLEDLYAQIPELRLPLPAA